MSLADTFATTAKWHASCTSTLACATTLTMTNGTPRAIDKLKADGYVTDGL
jgi:hypothetical protein